MQTIFFFSFVIFQSRFHNILELHESCCKDEILFGLEVSIYEILNQRWAELKTLQKLYGFYRTVKNSITNYYDIAWKDTYPYSLMADIIEYKNRHLFK